jgi:hypothetical protein
VHVHVCCYTAIQKQAELRHTGRPRGWKRSGINDDALIETVIVRYPCRVFGIHVDDCHPPTLPPPKHTHTHTDTQIHRQGVYASLRWCGKGTCKTPRTAHLVRDGDRPPIHHHQALPTGVRTLLRWRKRRGVV